jgi:hypothetical protein
MEVSPSSTFWHSFKQHNWSTSQSKLTFTVRFLCILTLIICAISNSINGWGVQQIEVSCIEDQFFKQTSSINSYFSSNDLSLTILQSCSSILTDFLFLCFGFFYILEGNSCQPILFLLLFYSLAAVLRLLFVIRPADGSSWEDPILPSLLIPGQRTPDFYYSALSGVLLFFAFYFKSERRLVLLGLSLFSLCFVCSSIVILQRDYSVAVISGLMMAHYFWVVSGWMSPCIDKHLG